VQARQRVGVNGASRAGLALGALCLSRLFALVIVRAHRAWRDVDRWHVLANERGPRAVTVDVAGGGFADELA
jgi:hypothetical protein